MRINETAFINSNFYQDYKVHKDSSLNLTYIEKDGWKTYYKLISQVKSLQVFNVLENGGGSGGFMYKITVKINICDEVGEYRNARIVDLISIEYPSGIVKNFTVNSS